MALRPTIDVSKALIKTGTVGVACTYGYPVKLTADGVITNCSAGESADGIAAETQVTAGKQAQYYLLAGACIIPVKVSASGSATHGSYAIAASDGVTNAPALGGGTVAKNILGKFVQDGLASDVVGLLPGPFVGVSA